jgi:hypothetical protein
LVGSACLSRRAINSFSILQSSGKTIPTRMSSIFRTILSGVPALMETFARMQFYRTLAPTTVFFVDTADQAVFMSKGPIIALLDFKFRTMQDNPWNIARAM